MIDEVLSFLLLRLAQLQLERHEGEPEATGEEERRLHHEAPFVAEGERHQLKQRHIHVFGEDGSCLQLWCEMPMTSSLQCRLTRGEERNN